MDMSGRQVIAASRTDVWAALNDPSVLENCIEGCEGLCEIEPGRFEGTVATVIGPVKARFAGCVSLTDIVPLESYTISGEGKGGAAGFVKGQARIVLADHADGTALDYTVKANVGGKLAQLGSRLVDSFAHKHAQTFFERLKTRLESACDAPAAGDAAYPLTETASTKAQSGSNDKFWLLLAVAAAAVAAVAGYLLVG